MAVPPILVALTNSDAIIKACIFVREKYSDMLDIKAMARHAPVETKNEKSFHKNERKKNKTSESLT